MPIDISSKMHDLITPDGYIESIAIENNQKASMVIAIKNIPAKFLGFQIEPDQIFFNLKSTLGQLGFHSSKEELHLDFKNQCAFVKINLFAIGPVAEFFLKTLEIGSYIGKLFAVDKRRLVRDPEYLTKMFDRSDKKGIPLLSLEGMNHNNKIPVEKIEGRAVVYLPLQQGKVVYKDSIYSFLPTISSSLKKNISVRQLLSLHQERDINKKRIATSKDILLVQTKPLYIRTVFASVINNLLPQGYCHTSASILDPNTCASGDIYELYGQSKHELKEIPLEFFTLEPHREHIFFDDRNKLKENLEDFDALNNFFKAAPMPEEDNACTFIVKDSQFESHSAKDWFTSPIKKHNFPGITQANRQSIMVDKYIKNQASFNILNAIEEEIINSQGVLFSRYLPSTLMKQMLISNPVRRCLKRIYFQTPSASCGDFFSQEDRAFLIDLAKFAIPTYWVDKRTEKILQYVQIKGKEHGMFVPINRVSTYLKATIFGLYGSNLIKGGFEVEVCKLFKGLLNMKKSSSHHLLNDDTPLALITGGGPGAMEVGNKVARDLGILSCANIVDFRGGEKGSLNEQHQNQYIEAKMTYRIDKLVERQAEFNLDFPIFLAGGIGTDFELCLEEVRRKVGFSKPTPVLLFGPKEYWSSKITSRFKCNLNSGTIKGSEWVSNCFFCIENAEQGLKVYKEYFEGHLKIGPQGPIYENGFSTTS